MELETIKTKIATLESKVKIKQDEINKLGEEKAHSKIRTRKRK